MTPATIAILAWAVAAWSAPDPTVPPAAHVEACTDAGCHAREISAAELHAPVAVGACRSCHAETDPAEHSFILKRDGSALCAFCHLGKRETAGLVVHQPVAEGRCLDCHDPHGGATRAFLDQPSAGENCRSCHGEHLDAQGATPHTPVAEGRCLECHAAHTARLPGLLDARGAALCLRCHPGHERAPFLAGPAGLPGPLERPASDALDVGGPLRRGLGVAANLARLASFVHDPVRRGCEGCHRTHASDEPDLLVKPGATLCADCHGAVVAGADLALVPHGPVSDATGCLNCHTPHASSVRPLLHDEPLALCGGCHPGPDASADERERSWITLALRSGGELHAHERGGCEVCHDVHGADYPRLLRAPYAQEMYSAHRAGRGGLCAGCHGEAMITEPTTRTETAFRNGEVNLHYVHVVAPGPKGRACRACHVAHLSDRARLTAEVVEFGEWSLPVRFEPTETGGSCAAGCHRARAYDRVAPIEPDPAPTPTQAR